MYFGEDAWRGMIIFFVSIGVALGFVLFVIIPWLWGIAKPFIHSVTA